MIRLRLVPAVLLLALLGLTGVRDAGADEGDVIRAFLDRRDAKAVWSAIQAGTVVGTPTQRALVRWAAGVPVDPAVESALVQAVGAMRRGALSPARRLLAVAERETPGIVVTWLGALVRARSGDDAGAQGRLMAPPLFLYASDAFDLALLAQALPAADRDVLVAMGGHALRRAASRARVPAVFSLALALVAFDPASGSASVPVALRALRRAGASDEAEALRVSVTGAHADLRAPQLAVESVLTAWHHVPSSLAARIGLLDPAAGGIVERLRLATRAPRRVGPAQPLYHRTGAGIADVLAARMLTAAGLASDEADVRASRLASKDAGPGFTRRLLMAAGMRAVSVAGDESIARRLLEAGHPFLLYRIVRDAVGCVERPVLVRGLDLTTDLWLLDEANVDRLDVLPRGRVARSRLLLAVPVEDAALLAGVEETPAGRLGLRLERALAREAQADHAGAMQVLAAADASGPRAPLARYLGYLSFRHAIRSGRGADLLPVLPQVDRGIGAGTPTAFEHYARGQALFVGRKPEAALAAFHEAVTLAGPSAALALARFAVHRATHADAAADAALNDALRLDPLDARALYLRGSLRARTADRAAARTDLRRALDRSPRSEPIAITLAQLEVAEGKPEAALAVLRELLRHAPRHADSRRVRTTREAAELSLLGAAHTVEDLRGFRRSAHPDVRRALAFRLAGIESAEAEIQLRALITDEDAGVRVTALRLYMRPELRRRVETDAVLLRSVVQVLQRDLQGSVRAAAAQLLGRVRVPAACRALAAVLTGPDRDTVAVARCAAARALAGQPVAEAQGALIAGLADPDATVRAASIDSLFRLTGRRGGFAAEADAGARAQAVAGWKEWLREQGAK